jgi:hypothetical protein
MREKEQLNDNQKAFIKRTQTTRDRLQTPFHRPSKPVYQAQPHLLVGVSLGLEKPATVAVVDAVKGKALTYRSIKQLRARSLQTSQPPASATTTTGVCSPQGTKIRQIH